MKGRQLIAIYGLSLLCICSLFNSCEPYRQSRPGKTSTLGNPNREDDTVFAVAKYGQIKSLSICIKQLTLTNADGAEFVVEYTPQKELPIPLDGIDIGALAIPPGQYQKIALNLDNVCQTGRSIGLSNALGTFTNGAPLSLIFAGNEFAGHSQKKIVLNLDAIETKLSQVMSDANVLNAANTSGIYHSVGCGIQSNPASVAFCETFDSPATTISRAGQLNSAQWTVSRSGPSNQGQGEFSIWNSSSLDACGTMQSANAGSDLVVCNGQLRQSLNDGDQVRGLNMMPNRPFDFAGRTGTIAFDITNDTSGSTGTWPEIWISDQPLPALQSFADNNLPRNGISIQLSGNLSPNQGAFAPGCVNDNNNRWIVGGVTLVNNGVLTASPWSISNDENLKTLGCVIAADGPNGKMNHIELKVSQGQIEVWASDAGSPILKRIASIENLALPFTRGYISFSDQHNHASAGPRPATKNHTYAWDNIAFDGPMAPRDLVFNVLDSLSPVRAGVVNLGWQTSIQTPAQLTTASLTAADLSAAQASGGNVTLSLTFNVPFSPVTEFQYSVNGVRLSSPPPMLTEQYSSYSVELPVPVAALVSGPQSISIWGNDILLISNIDIRLRGAGR